MNTLEVGTRVRFKNRVLWGILTGTVTGKTGRWYHVDWDAGIKPFSSNYYADSELEIAPVTHLETSCQGT